jgi:hypothetical protein
MLRLIPPDLGLKIWAPNSVAVSSDKTVIAKKVKEPGPQTLPPWLFFLMLLFCP